MSDNSSIEWCDATWSPTTGCDRVSPGCGLPRPGSDDEQTGRTGGCYALTLAKRLKAMGSAKYQTDGDPRTSGPGFGVAMHESALTIPLRWKKPRRIFVNAMSDLFHADITDEFIGDVFAIMALSVQHTFQVLTKRHARMRSLLSDVAFAGYVAGAAARLAGEHQPGRWHPGHAGRWPLPNVWLGVSVETQQWADIRVPALLNTPAAVRFLSCEPLLGPVDLSLWITGQPAPPDTVGLDWVITGGESGTRARPFELDWARDIRDQCTPGGVAYFHKQHGGRTPKANGRDLDGREWSEFPQAVTA